MQRADFGIWLVGILARTSRLLTKEDVSLRWRWRTRLGNEFGMSPALRTICLRCRFAVVEERAIVDGASLTVGKAADMLLISNMDLRKQQ
jgi:hypothetical protein